MESTLGAIIVGILLVVWYLWQINDQLKELNRRIKHLKDDWDARGLDTSTESDDMSDFYRGMAGMPKKE